MSRLLSRTRSAWTERFSSHAPCQTCRCFSQSSPSATAASPYHDGGRAQRTTRRPGLPEELAGKADLDSKTINTPVGDLPMSPLMDPTFYEARMKYKMPKAPESSVYKKVKWRRTLDRNPWGEFRLHSRGVCGRRSADRQRLSSCSCERHTQMSCHQHCNPKVLPPGLQPRLSPGDW